MILLRSPDHEPVRRTAAVIVVSLLVLFGTRISAQSLTFSLFERYLESLRLQAGIPGMSALIVQDGVVVWERGFGRADVERNIEATSATPYQLGGLSQIVGATLMLKECVDENSATLNDPVVLWNPFYPDRATTVAQLLGHVSPVGAYRFDLARFSALTSVIEGCSGVSYPRLVAEEVFSRLGLADSVPGTAVGAPTADDVEQFGHNNLSRYAAVLARAARTYRVDVRGRATRTDLPLTRPNAATGLVSTGYDLAKFDATLRYDILLRPETAARAWTPVAPGFPTGLGWFVQSYNGTLVLWQFGAVQDGHSALLLKLPTRGLTLILLANSEGLSAPFALDKGDVTNSVFARTFLRIYVP
jgi:CubicO group peptidase (beta-lactamase class C family)